MYHRRVQPPLLHAGPRQTLKEEDYDQALRERPTILYLHGNAASRAAPWRLASYAQFTTRLQANVVAIDYRGFADSPGSPTEDGLVEDARAAWDWIQHRKGGSTLQAGHQIAIVGQSLGTGVGAKLTRELYEEGTPPQLLVLIAPYRSFRRLAAGYKIGGLLPVLAPLTWIPGMERLLDRYLQAHFETEETLNAMYAADGQSSSSRRWPHLLISHATDDGVIPSAHGELLFYSLLRAEVLRRGDEFTAKPSEEASSPLAQRLQEAILGESLLEEDLLRKGEVSTVLHRGWARIQQFVVGRRKAKGSTKRVEASNQGPSITLIRGEWGGHNVVGEGIVDVLREILEIDENEE